MAAEDWALSVRPQADQAVFPIGQRGADPVKSAARRNGTLHRV